MNDLAVIKNLIPDNKIIHTVRESYSEDQKGPKDLKVLCEYLDKTTKTGLFVKICESAIGIPVTRSLLTIAADDSGETNLELSEDGKIIGISDIEMPFLRRYSMMFYPYLFEETNCLFYKSRIGQDYSPHEDMMVLPYFVLLYAIKHSEELFEKKSINAALSIFIGNVYSGLTEGICDVRSGVFGLAGVMADDTNVSIFDYVDLNKTKLHMNGMVKAIALYDICEQTGDFDSVLSSVYNSDLTMGNEIDFSNPNLDIKSEFLFNSYRNFLLKNYDCLRNVGDPDEYKRIEITVGEETAPTNKKDGFYEPYLQTKHYKDILFRRELNNVDKEEPDLILYIVSEPGESDKKNYLTFKEMYWKYGHNNVYYLPHLEFHKSKYGKNNVVFYNDKSFGDPIWIKTIENGEELQFDYFASYEEGRYVWRKAEEQSISKEYLEEISNRLGLSL